MKKKTKYLCIMSPILKKREDNIIHSTHYCILRFRNLVEFLIKSTKILKFRTFTQYVSRVSIFSNFDEFTPSFTNVKNGRFIANLKLQSMELRRISPKPTTVMHNVQRGWKS